MWNLGLIPLLKSAQAMLFHKSICGIMAVAALSGFAAAQSPRSASVEKVTFVGDNPVRLQIQTSAPLTPAIQVISNPERLVIDLPNAEPGRGLRGFALNRGEVRGVRTSLYSRSPMTTRIVVDLNTPQWYRVTPDGAGMVISLGGEKQGASGALTTVGWVSTRSSAQIVERPQAMPAVASMPAAVPVRSPLVNGATVRFANGQLSIHATNASLSEILFQIQKVTGAEIAIPAGTEQQRVAGDFGPGTASQVLGDLLNGSGLNFVVVGSAVDPTQLRSVILSRKDGEADSPAAFAQQQASDSAENFDSDDTTTVAPAPAQQQTPPQGQMPPPQQGAPDSGPPADPPPTT